MKQLITALFLVLLLSKNVLQASTGAQPIYLYLYARVTDHVNIDIAEDQLRRILPMIDEYSKQYPNAHVSATVLFSGAVSQAFESRNSQTHIVDLVRDYIRRGVIEPGYDGADEPTFVNRPSVDLTGAKSAEDRWLLRTEAEKSFLTEGRDPLSGTLQPGKAGGLKAMQQVFGNAVCITGLTLPMKIGPGVPAPIETGVSPDPTPVRVPPSAVPEVGGDSEAVELLRRENSAAIMFGVLDVNLAHLPGYRPGLAGFARLISPLPYTPPELYWQDGVLRTSEASSDTVRLLHARDGSETVRKALDKVDRSRTHIIHLELASDQNYLQPGFIKGTEYPPLKYAYQRPLEPRLPPNALRPKSEIEASYAIEGAVLKSLSAEFAAGNLNDRFVSSTELRRLVVPSTGFRISMDGLRSGIAEYLKNWGNDTYAPPLFQADGHYLSMAEMFQVMADALAEFSRSRKLPEAVEVGRVYGPVRVLTGHGPNAGDITVASIARICAHISPELHDSSSTSIPKNAVPVGLKVDSIMLNPTQFLKLMAQAIQNPNPEAKLQVRMSYEMTGLGELLPKSRPLSDDGYAWTLKPAQLRTDKDSLAKR